MYHDLNEWDRFYDLMIHDLNEWDWFYDPMIVFVFGRCNARETTTISYQIQNLIALGSRCRMALFVAASTCRRAALRPPLLLNSSPRHAALWPPLSLNSLQRRVALWPPLLLPRWLTLVAIRPLPFLPSSSLPGRIAFYLLPCSVFLPWVLWAPPSTTTTSRKLLLIRRLLKPWRLPKKHSERRRCYRKMHSIRISQRYNKSWLSIVFLFLS